MGSAWQKVQESGVLAQAGARCSEPPPSELLQGIAQFNAGDYYECHEVLEDLWRSEADPIRYLYQGILQVGVGLHHLRNENFRGAQALLRAGVLKLACYPSPCMQVDVSALLADARRCLDAAAELTPETSDAFDWSLAPTIKLTDDRCQQWHP